jgi:hypothetical protein
MGAESTWTNSIQMEEPATGMKSEGTAREGIKQAIDMQNDLLVAVLSMQAELAAQSCLSKPGLYTIQHVG